MRKVFDIEVSKLQGRIGELELKLASAAKEKKEELASIGSKMEVTSMTLLRHTEEKEKYAAFSMEEKRRLQKMISSKDHEIEQLLEKIEMLQRNHENEIIEKDEQIEILKKTI